MDVSLSKQFMFKLSPKALERKRLRADSFYLTAFYCATLIQKRDPWFSILHGAFLFERFWAQLKRKILKSEKRQLGNVERTCGNCPMFGRVSVKELILRWHDLHDYYDATSSCSNLRRSGLACFQIQRCSHSQVKVYGAHVDAWETKLGHHDDDKLTSAYLKENGSRTSFPALFTALTRADLRAQTT